MDNVLEKQRAYVNLSACVECPLMFVFIYSAHEDLERIEQAIVDQYMDDAKTHREKLYNEHVVDKFLTRIADKSAYLADLYQDKDG